MDEGTLVSDDHNKYSPLEDKEKSSIEVSKKVIETSNVSMIGKQLYSKFTEIKQDMNNKNLDEAKDCLENFRKGMNLVFGNQQQFPYNIKRVLKEFNNECDKIRFSKNTVCNYRKCIVDTMEEFLN